MEATGCLVGQLVYDATWGGQPEVHDMPGRGMARGPQQELEL